MNVTIVNKRGELAAMASLVAFALVFVGSILASVVVSYVIDHPDSRPFLIALSARLAFVLLLLSPILLLVASATDVALGSTRVRKLIMHVILLGLMGAFHPVVQELRGGSVPVWAAIEPRLVAALRERTQAMQRARTEAKADIEAGRLRIKGFGLAWPDADRDRLFQRYGIQTMNLGCVVDDARLRNVKAYNAVIEEELERRYGKGFWESFEAELKGIKSVP